MSTKKDATTEVAETTVGGLFKKLYGATDDAIKASKRGLVEKKLKRTIESARDNAEDRKLNAEEQLDKLARNFDNFDINAYLEQKRMIASCEKVSADIADVYLEFFGETIKK